MDDHRLNNTYNQGWEGEDNSIVYSCKLSHTQTLSYTKSIIYKLSHTFISINNNSYMPDTETNDHESETAVSTPQTKPLPRTTVKGQ